MTRDAHQAPRAIDRIADRIDLAIDLMTLGQYGLERVPAAAAGNEGCGSRSCREEWEAPQPARRRGSSPRPVPRAGRLAR